MNDAKRNDCQVQALAAKMLADEILAAIVCPLTRSKLIQQGDELVAAVGGMRYPIRDGIPVLLADQATLPEGVDDLEAFKKKFGNDLAGGD